MAALMRGVGTADEIHDDPGKAREFLDPEQRVVEEIARHDLQEDSQGKGDGTGEHHQSLNVQLQLPERVLDLRLTSFKHGLPPAGRWVARAGVSRLSCGPIRRNAP